ncbi:hypothetical protein CsSME_00019986 [Camellia sinensis var. sinensis]
MVHSLIPVPGATAPPISISTSLSSSSSHSNSMKKAHLPSSSGFHRAWVCHQASSDQPLQHTIVYRRSAIALGLAGAVLGLNIGNQSASAAARRPPPPPPEEKKDPSVSGLQAKILASKKRKEAMKETMEKLRERGKPVTGPSE